MNDFRYEETNYEQSLPACLCVNARRQAKIFEAIFLRLRLASKI